MFEGAELLLITGSPQLMAQSLCYINARAQRAPSNPGIFMRSIMLPTLLLLAACDPAPKAAATDTATTDTTWRPATSDLSPPQQAQRDRARAAAQDLGAALLGRVAQAVAADGHAAAIDACKQDAPAITARATTTHKVRIGRTAARLRNAENGAPAWAADAIAAQAATPTIMLRGDGALAALLPIKLADACVACHGAPDQLAPGVAAALASRYPGDQATGFAPGDLRGWFWVEVAP